MDQNYITPPQVPDIERAVLSACLFERESIDITTEKICQESFYKPANALIYRAITELYAEDAPVDQLTVVEWLRQNGVLGQVGGEAAIASLAGEITGAANVAYHCGILNEYLAKRQLIALTTSIRNLCFENGSDSEEMASELHNQAAIILEKGSVFPYRNLAEIIPESYRWLTNKSTQKGPMGVSTGITILDKYIDGFLPEKLIVLAGKTGEGKSALAVNSFALNAARHGEPTAVFSLEMSDLEIGVRLISGEARMDLSAVQYKPPTPDEWKHLSECAGRLTKLPIFIDETPGISIAKIGAKIRRLQRDHGIKLVVVDYLQLMEGKMTNSREQEVASISRGLKLLAKSLHIPILVLSQFSRAIDKADRRPIKSDLRESGAIEHDADVILFIYDAKDTEKQEYPVSGTPELKADIRELIIAKNRGGKTGTVLTLWKCEHVTFHNLDY